VYSERYRPFGMTIVGYDWPIYRPGLSWAMTGQFTDLDWPIDRPGLLGGVVELLFPTTFG
jgi:hypothetical protein